jgi:hypothetical protein
MDKKEKNNMKIIQVVNAFPALQKLAGQELTTKSLYKISKLFGNLEREIAFYNEQRNKILTKHCDIVGNQYVPRKEDEEKLNAELDELLNIEIECEIKEVVIGVDENIKLSYNDLVMLQGLVRIEGEE